MADLVGTLIVPWEAGRNHGVCVAVHFSPDLHGRVAVEDGGAFSADDLLPDGVAIGPIPGPAGFNMHDGAIGETDHGDGDILDIEAFEMRAFEMPRQAGLVFSDEIPRRTKDGDGLGLAHHVMGDIDDVDAEIDERPAAGILLAAEPAAGETQAPQPAGLGVINLAEIAAIHHLANELRFGTEALVEAAHHDRLVSFGRINHGFRVFRIHGHGFFGEDVDAVFGGGNADGRMKGVAGADADGVEVHLVEHYVVIGEGVRDLILGSDLVHALLALVADGDDFNAGKLLIDGEVSPDPRASDSNHTDSKRFSGHAGSFSK